VNTYNNRPFYYSQIRINPTDDQRVYLLTTRFMVSEDGGRTIRNGSEDQEIHGDFHAMWIDPLDGDRYYIGDDKGMHLTFDHGDHFFFLDNLPIAQYYRIGVDMRDPYYVYGGLQDNGTYGGPSFARDNRGILSDHNWKLHWGDGQDIQIDPTDWRTLYTEAENGSFRRYDVLTHKFSGARPNAATHKFSGARPNAANVTNYTAAIPESERQGGREFRYNWSAPLVMSPHDPRTLFLGGQYVFKTTNQGESWTIISPDLTTNDPEKRERGRSGGLTPDNSGAEQHCTITSISQSAISRDIIWVGTDDGNVQVTMNGGSSWANVRTHIVGVPEGVWLGRLEASHHDPGTAYVTFDGHRSDVFTPWVFKTTDYGVSWTNIGSSIPDGQVVHVIREDRHNPDLLFVGTEFGVFVSLNGGNSWVRFHNGFPTVAVQDMVIHPRDNDLIAGTHGRAMWIMDDITPLQQLTDEVLAADAYLFQQRMATLWENTSRGGQRGHFWFAGENPPSVEPTSSMPRAEFHNVAFITYYIGRTPSSTATLEISDVSGRNRFTAPLATEPGIHRFRWERHFDPEPLTGEQVARVNGVFETVIETVPFLQRQVQAAHTRFQRAQTPLQQRQAAEVLLNPYLETGLSPQEFGVPVAGPGTYKLVLTIDDESYTNTLTIRADPLLSGRQ
jgi:hypothetical protein